MSIIRVGILLSTLFLSACTSIASQLEDILGVVPDEHAVSCVSITTHVTGTFSAGSIAVKRIEWPTSFDIASLTVEDSIRAEEAICP